MRLRQRLNRSRSNIELLKRQSEFSLPQPSGNFVVTAAFAGNDDCPGQPIASGTYTAGSPFVDVGDTTGANSTVSSYPGYYYYYSALGPDHIYSFTLTGRGPNSKIEVSTTSGTYRPLVYVLVPWFGAACPAGTGNIARSVVGYSDSRWTPGSNTVTLMNTDEFPLNVPLYLFIDSAANDSSGAGPYTLRMEGVTIAPGPTCSNGNLVANAIDCTDFFVRQHYFDFLGREPDEAGYEGWQNILNNCGVTVAQPCDRIEVSSAFFRSPEFQGRGYFVYRFFSAIGKVPTYDEFNSGFAGVRGFLTDQQLEAAKTAFANGFVNRRDFQDKYNPTLGNPAAFVDALLQTVGLPNHPSRQAWINSLTGNNTVQRRAQVLRALVESNEVYQKYYNEAFVVMQYFGFLHRTADAHYLDWVQTMNQNGGDYRVMINGFLNSTEYRQRFGP